VLNLSKKIEKRNKKRVLVTGIFGFLGRALCERLLGLGYDVVNIDIKLDIKNIEELKMKYLGEKVDYIYHLAGKSDVAYAEKNPIEALEVNVAGTWNIMELARELGVKCVFVASTERLGNNIDNDISIYDTSKLCSESVAKAYHHRYGVSIVICRFGIIFGEGDTSQTRLIPSVVRSLLRNEICIINNSADIYRKYIYLEDAVSALIYLTDDVESFHLRKGSKVEITYPKTYSIKYVVESLVAASGKKHLCPVFKYAKSSKGNNFSVQNICEIGWIPQYTMEDSLLRTYSWYKRNTKA
jgi:nucleoside-diphosphate-sugar epimerase